jgi:hypothetical protein
VEKNDTTDVKTEVKELLDLAKNEMVIDQLDISSLAPRQPDWDLKRDAEKKTRKTGKTDAESDGGADTREAKSETRLV